MVGGGFPVAQLRAVLLADSATSRRGAVELLLVTGHDAAGLTTDTAAVDTVLATGGPLPRADRPASMHAVALPGGGRWFLAVYHTAESPVRLQLWGVALAALGALVVGAWHERRQSRRIADRSRELEHLSEELLRANRAKSEFLANVSHELRTPLNAIVGFTELLRDGVYGELTPRQAGPVQRIEASASHLRTLVDQVLDLAKITAGRLEVNRELVEVRQVLLDIGTEMEPLFAERGLAFSLNLGAGVPRVRTDPVHLRQILVNLLGNAVKFTERGGVTVRTRLVAPGGDARPSGGVARPAEGDVAAGGADAARPPAAAASAWAPEGGALRAGAPDPRRPWVVVQVIDTGAGIAASDHARIFDEFEQVNAGSRGDSEHRGTGLGLPISRRLARLLGGDLTVESAPGRGSVFTLWLRTE
jgi:signal transduction histidine kinase